MKSEVKQNLFIIKIYYITYESSIKTRWLGAVYPGSFYSVNYFTCLFRLLSSSTDINQRKSC